MKARKTELKKPNKDGNYFRELGYSCLKPKKQPRFNLGKDKVEAEKRADRLLELLHDCEVLSDGIPYWSPFALHAARKLAQGETQINYAPPLEELDDCDDQIDRVARYVRLFRDQQEMYPSLTLIPSHPDLYSDGVLVNASMSNNAVEKLQEVLHEESYLPKDQRLPEKIFPGTLHEALDRHAEKIRLLSVEGKRGMSEWEAQRIKQTQLLKKHVLDSKLMYLDCEQIKRWIASWCKKPLNARTGKPMADTTIRNILKELKQFLVWLDDTGEFKWESPKRFNSIKWRPTSNFSDNTHVDIDTFSIPELLLLNKYATPRERLILLIGLNTGFCSAEMGSLKISNILLRQPHPNAEKIDWTPVSDSYIRFRRPKSSVVGEFILFDQTIKVLQHAIETRLKLPNIENDLLFVNEQGLPLYRRGEGRSNNGHYFARAWKELLERVTKDYPKFPQLSVKYLRKTATDRIHQTGDSYLSRIFAMHNSPADDPNMKSYTKVSVAKLFEVMKIVEGELAAVFTAAPKNLFAQPRQQYTSLANQEKIQEMLQKGVAIPEIANHCQVSKITVYRERKLLSEILESNPMPNINSK